MVRIRRPSLSNDFDTEFLYGDGEFGDANLLVAVEIPPYTRVSSSYPVGQFTELFFHSGAQQLGLSW